MNRSSICGGGFTPEGSQKFGLDEIETFQPIGLSERNIEPMFYGVACQLMAKGKNSKVGEHIPFGEEGQQVKVVRHRTDPIIRDPIGLSRSSNNVKN